MRFTLAILRRGLHRLRPLRRGLPGEQPGRSRHARRSTWSRQAPLHRGGTRATSRSSRRCRSTTAPASTSPTCAACSSWSRCSSSPAPAPAAARRPYLKLLSQLFGDRMHGRERDRLLVDLRRQPAGDALDARTAKAAARPGRTRCSRTTPSSGSASASPPTSISSSRASCSRGLRRSSARIWSSAILTAPQIARIRNPRPARARGRAQAKLRARATGSEAHAICSRWSTISCAAASGSSAATAGPTTSAMAASTTCWPRRATSTCWCWTPRSTRTPAARRRRRRRSARSPSSPPPASASPARIWRCRRSPTATSTWRRSPWAPTRSRRCRPSARPRPIAGPSLILAYSHCIAHGIDMRYGMKQQDLAVASGYWPLFRYNPGDARRSAKIRSVLDSPRPTDVASGITPTTKCATGRWRRRGRRRPKQLLAPGAGGGRGEVPLLRGDGGHEGGPTAARVTTAAGRAGRSAMDLTTRYLGLELKNPLVARQSRSTSNSDNIRRSGRSAAPPRWCSLDLRGADRAGGKRQIERLIAIGTDSYRRGADTISRRQAAYVIGSGRYLELIARPAQGRGHPGHRQPERGHGRRAGSTTRARIEEAGASAIELNIYFIPSDLDCRGARSRIALYRHRASGAGGP